MGTVAVVSDAELPVSFGERFRTLIPAFLAAWARTVSGSPTIESGGSSFTRIRGVGS